MCVWCVCVCMCVCRRGEGEAKSLPLFLSPNGKVYSFSPALDLVIDDKWLETTLQISSNKLTSDASSSHIFKC